MTIRIAHRSAWQVFRIPLLVGMVCLAGLAFALIGDGVWDGVSWFALSVPVLLAVIYAAKAIVAR